MGRVRGPFLEYECTKCGATIQETAPRNQERLVDRIADANANPGERVCASCWDPGDNNLE